MAWKWSAGGPRYKCIGCEWWQKVETTGGAPQQRANHSRVLREETLEAYIWRMEGEERFSIQTCSHGLFLM
jgi:hypothetical protein